MHFLEALNESSVDTRRNATTGGHITTTPMPHSFLLRDHHSMQLRLWRTSQTDILSLLICIAEKDLQVKIGAIVASELPPQNRVTGMSSPGVTKEARDTCTHTTIEGRHWHETEKKQEQKTTMKVSKQKPKKGLPQDLKAQIHYELSKIHPYIYM